MGNSARTPQQYQIVSTYNSKDWVVKDSLPNYQIWENKRGNVEAEAYEVPANWQSSELDKYTFRNKNSKDIVGVYHAIKQQNDYLCSSSNKMYILTERIPLRLDQINQINDLQALSILLSAFSGYNTIGSNYGPVFPDNFCICINKMGKPKVWINSNLALNTPLIHQDLNDSQQLQKRNKIYTQQIFDLVVVKTITGLPQLRRIFEQKQPTYFEAINIIQNYAQAKGIIIPQNIIPQNIKHYNQTHNIYKPPLLQQSNTNSFKAVFGIPQPIYNFPPAKNQMPSRSFIPFTNPTHNLLGTVKSSNAVTMLNNNRSVQIQRHKSPPIVFINNQPINHKSISASLKNSQIITTPITFNPPNQALAFTSIVRGQKNQNQQKFKIENKNISGQNEKLIMNQNNQKVVNKNDTSRDNIKNPNNQIQNIQLHQKSNLIQSKKQTSQSKKLRQSANIQEIKYYEEQLLKKLANKKQDNQTNYQNHNKRRIRHNQIQRTQSKIQTQKIERDQNQQQYPNDQQTIQYNYRSYKRSPKKQQEFEQQTKSYDLRQRSYQRRKQQYQQQISQSPSQSRSRKYNKIRQLSPNSQKSYHSKRQIAKLDRQRQKLQKEREIIEQQLERKRKLLQDQRQKPYAQRQSRIRKNQKKIYQNQEEGKIKDYQDQVLKQKPSRIRKNNNIKQNQSTKKISQPVSDNQIQSHCKQQKINMQLIKSDQFALKHQQNQTQSLCNEVTQPIYTISNEQSQSQLTKKVLKQQEVNQEIQKNIQNKEENPYQFEASNQDIQSYIRKKYNIQNKSKSSITKKYSNNFQGDEELGRHNLITFMPQDYDNDINELRKLNEKKNQIKKFQLQGTVDVAELEKNLQKFTESRVKQSNASSQPKVFNKATNEAYQAKVRIQTDGNNYKYSKYIKNNGNEEYQQSFKSKKDQTADDRYKNYLRKKENVRSIKNQPYMRQIQKQQNQGIMKIQNQSTLFKKDKSKVKKKDSKLSYQYLRQMLQD